MSESNIIKVYIRALRIKLEASNSKLRLHTVRGFGYVLREQKLGGAGLQILGI
jgi:DNA-binding response OmpR family regulator